MSIVEWANCGWDQMAIAVECASSMFAECTHNLNTMYIDTYMGCHFMCLRCVPCDIFVLDCTFCFGDNCGSVVDLWPEDIVEKSLSMGCFCYCILKFFSSLTDNNSNAQKQITIILRHIAQSLGMLHLLLGS